MTSEKNYTPWNKGIPQSEKAKKKQSETWKHKLENGYKSPNRGRKHSEKSKRNMSIAHIGNIPWNKGKKGKNSPNWKGGRSKQNGYWIIHKPDHPRSMSNNYVFEHILIAEKMLGRSLKSEEIVHHINFNGLDNREENIHIFKNKSKHGKVKKSLFKLTTYLLEKGFIKFDKKKRKYLFVKIFILIFSEIILLFNLAFSNQSL